MKDQLQNRIWNGLATSALTMAGGGVVFLVLEGLSKTVALIGAFACLAAGFVVLVRTLLVYPAFFRAWNRERQSGRSDNRWKSHPVVIVGYVFIVVLATAAFLLARIHP